MIEYLYKKVFLKDLKSIPKNDREKFENLILEEIPRSFNPFSFGILEKMKGYRNYYKIKVGNYRIGIYFNGTVFEFQRVLHRKDIYKFFP